MSQPTFNQPTFNLIDEPWIPVAMRDGTNTELSLRDLFARAHEARGFNEPSPLTYVSVARFLLAVAHRALRGPASPVAWVDLWRQERFDPAPFDAYFARWHDCFDLFDAEKPFAQAPLSAFPSKEQTKPLSKLALEQASGTNATLFDHTADDNEPTRSPAEAVRKLLTAMNFGFGEGGIYKGTTLLRFVTFLIEGSNLFETLMLNLQTYYYQDASESSTADAPWWESNAPLTETKEETLPRGLSDHLTRRGRKVHLQRNDEGQITGMLYRPGIAFDSSTEGSDPFFAWHRKKDGTLSPLRFQGDHALWRDFEVMLQTERTDVDSSAAPGLRPSVLDHLQQVATLIDDLRENGEDVLPLPPLKLMAFGLVLPRAGQAAVDLWRMEQLPLPVSLLSDRSLVTVLHDALEFAELAGQALNSAGRRLATSLLTEGDRSPDKTDVANQLNELRLDERFWPRLELEFHTFLHGVTDDRDAALRTWMGAVLDLARDAYNQASQIVGADARSIRASMLGLRTLYGKLKPLRERYEQYQEESTVEGVTTS